MKILLVEDDDVKRARVSTFLSDKYPGSELVVARSLQSGIRRIKQQKFSLVVLDMTLPNYDPGPEEPGGKPQLFGGRELLRQMDRFDIVIPVIVLTQFAAFGKDANLVTLEDLDKELREEHSSVYKGAVYYNAAFQKWMMDLNVLLDGIEKEGNQ